MTINARTIEKLLIISGVKYELGDDRIDVLPGTENEVSIFELGEWIHLRKLLLSSELTANAKSARALLTAISLINMRALGCRVTVDSDGAAYILADIGSECSDEGYPLTIVRQIGSVHRLIVGVLTNILTSGDIIGEVEIDDIFAQLG